MNRLSAFSFFTLICTSLSAAIGASPASESTKAALQQMTVYRSPTCSCCGKWIANMQQNGFVVDDRVSENMDEIKDRFGIADNLRSCHTAVVNGHLIEGHVPFEDIKRLLQGSTGAKNITVPGMPVGTPGMEMGGRKDPYDVLEFDKSGKTTVFHHHAN